MITVIIIPRGVEADTMDVGNMLFKKETWEILSIHVVRLYLGQYIIWSYFLEIDIFMDVTDWNYNVFGVLGDTIIIYDVYYWLAIIQDTDRFEKINNKK